MQSLPLPQPAAHSRCCREVFWYQDDIIFTAWTGVCSLGDSHNNKVINKAEKALVMWICEMWGHGQWPHWVELGPLWTTQEPERCTVLTLSLSCRLSLPFWANSLNLLFPHYIQSSVKTSDTLFAFSLGFINNDLIFKCFEECTSHSSGLKQSRPWVGAWPWEAPWVCQISH